MSYSKKRWIPVVLGVIALMASIACVTIILSAKSSTASNRPTVISSVTPMAVYQPPSAKDVAGSLSCVRFEDHGPSPVGGSVDSGSCYIKGRKYAINTFASKAARDAWLVDAEPLGVVPKWETDTSVTYPSVA